MIVAMLGSQFMLYLWQRLHPKSWKVVTLLGIWIAPIAWGYYNAWWGVEIVWGIVTLLSGYVVWIATRKPLAKDTPKFVYAFFRFLFKVNTTMLFGGNMLVMLDFLGIPMMVLQWPTGKLSLYGWWFCFVGLYFGLLLRDFSDVCTSSMAATMGYYSKVCYASPYLYPLPFSTLIGWLSWCMYTMYVSLRWTRFSLHP